MSINAFFTATVAQHPDVVALECAGDALTYAELDVLVERNAAMLTDVTGPRVALWATRTTATYVGYLAIQRAGFSVVPLNPDYPDARTLSMIEHSGAGHLLGNDVPPAITASGIETRPIAAGSPAGPRPASPGVADPCDEAYLLFTSGSTGTPKGIPIHRANLADFVPYNVERYDVKPGTRMSQTFSLTFDPSVFDMAVAWHGGATLVVPDRAQLLDPVGFVRDAAITHWYSVPSLITAAQVAGCLQPGSMPDLRWSLFAGEQLPLSSAADWQRAAPNSVVENLYGPTELTVTVSHHRLPQDIGSWPETSNASVPIGTIYPHLKARVDVATGELQVRGSQRFAGYLESAANRGRFEPEVADSPPGREHWYRTGDKVTESDAGLVHLGRLDRQVKLAGRRVELGDIESALRSAGAVDDAAVVTPSTGSSQLVAICIGTERDPRAMRQALRSVLPTHMVPRRYLWIERLPLTPNGKVDYAACLELCH